MAVRGLLFDFDGLIVDTETPSLASWQELYREHGHELPLEQWITLVGTIGAPFDPYAHLEELAGSASTPTRCDHVSSSSNKIRVPRCPRPTRPSCTQQRS